MRTRWMKTLILATIGIVPVLSSTTANAAAPFLGQEVLVDCPHWYWEPVELTGVVYELCFDDIDHCTVADIGDSVCIPSSGIHDVWVTAIDYGASAPRYSDGDIVSIRRIVSADFTGDGIVEFGDFSFFANSFGQEGPNPADMDKDGVVGFADFGIFRTAFGRCVSDGGYVYEECQAP